MQIRVIKKPCSKEQGFFIFCKKNYFLTESAAAAAESTVAVAESATAVTVESTAATVESTADSVLDVQAAKEATHATNKIAITFFIVLICDVF